VDLVLSSGFLAFASHAGFLAAVEDAGVDVGGVCGTSSGALAGVGIAAGLPRSALLELLFEKPPAWFLRPTLTPWRGFVSLRAVIALLRDRVPATFEGLSMPFGVGVMNDRGEAELVTSGPLPEAVAASMAIPRIFAAVPVAGRPLADGGMVDRTGLGAWRVQRPGADVLLHLLKSTGGAFGGKAGEGDPGDATPGVRVVRSPRSGASFLDLGDVRGRFEAARARTLAVLESP